MWGLEVSKFEQQLRCSFHFQTNTLKKGMHTLAYSEISWIVSLLFFYKYGFGNKQPTKVDILFKKRNETKQDESSVGRGRTVN